MRFIVVMGMLFSLSPAWADIESEPNGTEAVANVLSPGTITTGQLANDDDIDYFQIAVGNSDALNIDFASPNSVSDDNRWFIVVQRPSDGIIIYQEALNPTADTPISRVVEITENGNYILFIAPLGGSNPTPVAEYDLTVTPSNFQAPLSSFNGVWQDDIGAAVYSVHEGNDGILYIELPLDGSAWKAYLGGRTDNVATLNQIVGPGSSSIELSFITTSTLEARYLSCQLAGGGNCAVANGELIYTATFIFGD